MTSGTYGPRVGRLLPVAGWSVVLLVVFLPSLLLLWSVVDFSARNPERLLDAVALASLGRSALLAAAATFIAVVIGVPAGILLETWRVPARLRTAVRVVVLVAVFLPPYYQVAAWRPLMGVLPGANPALRFPLAALLLGVAHAPLLLFFTAHGVRAISGDLLDAALLFGRSRWSVLARVLVPLSAPSLLAGASLVFVMALLNYELPALLMLPVYPVRVLVEYQLRYQLDSAMVFALPLLLLTVAAAVLLGRLFDRVEWTVTADASPRPSPAFHLGAGWGTAAALLALLLAGLPLARLLHIAGGGRFPEVAAETWVIYGREIVYGLAVTLVSAGAAVLLAMMVVPRNGRPRRWTGYLVWIPLAIPAPLLGAALIRLYNNDPLGWVYGSPAILVVASLARFFPITYHALRAHLRTVPVECWEAADLSPRGPLDRFWRVYLPLAAPGLALGACGFLLFQSAEIAVAVLVAPPGLEPIPLKVYSLLHYNTELEVPAALCVFQVALVLTMMASVQALGYWPLCAAGARRRSATGDSS